MNWKTYSQYIFAFLSLWLSISLNADVFHNEAKPKYRINIFSDSNGKGLEKSRQVLKNALTALGHEVFEKDLSQRKFSSEPVVDINIFFQFINSRCLHFAINNWFIPNPECYFQNLKLLDRIDLIVCRTHEVERIFQSLNKKTFYLGFTGYDCFIPSDIPKDYSVCLHAAGESPYKGTNSIMEAWKDRQDLPFLNIISHLSQAPYDQGNLNWIAYKLPFEEYRALQNSCGIHICTSETEGFGHYLVEAMSTGAVVITTDAPPMNEYITDKRCLVPYSSYFTDNLAIRYVVDSQALASAIKNLMSLSEKERHQIGIENRAKFEEKTAEFLNNLQELMQQFSLESEQPLKYIVDN